MTASDTIFALSSGAGRAAIAVIRVSGPAAAALLAALAGSLPAPRTLTLRRLRDPITAEFLDRAAVIWLPAPHSFTGEDCAELHVHGGPAVVTAVMQALGRHSGVRPAEAGEFTRRAFLNDKIDLVEAEGLGDLLAARTANQRRQAMRQMSGAASAVFESWREQLLLIRADIEAVVDFVDEAGVAEEAAPGINRRIELLITEISKAIDQSATAEIIRDGVRVVLAGLPNTGKSSLLNALARRDAAIVSDVPGTTRDAIEVSLDISGIPVILTDTAGLRDDVADSIEAEGIRRSKQNIAAADLVVWVWSEDVEGSRRFEQPPDLVVRNKSDLDPGLSRNELLEDDLQISVRSGRGVAQLVEKLSAILVERFGNAESCLLVSARQTSAAQNSIRFLNDALGHRDGPLELQAEAVRRAADEIARLTGRIAVEEWLGAIFSRFCIGK